ncbi:unnamed protein product, partial [Coregonus sp. 'balchen']
TWETIKASHVRSTFSLPMRETEDGGRLRNSRRGRTIADLVTEKDLSEGRLYPPLNTIRDVSLKLAVKMATLCPEPEDKEAFVRSLIYSTDYDEFAVDSYRWPEDAMTMQSCRL